LILVTGGAGFIGSHLVDKLVTSGQKVIIFDDFNDYYPSQFKEKNIAHHNANPNVVIMHGDITDTKALGKVFTDYSIQKVVHLAARAGVRPSIDNPKLYESVNIAGTLNILETMRKVGCKLFYFASSSSVYGNQKKVPFSETDSVDRPISPYAATKKACELLAYTYHHLYGFSAVGFRFFTVYGERGRPDMAPYLFTERILKGSPIKKFGDGSTERDYTYVGDIVDGVYQAFEKKLGYEIFNLGNHRTVTLNELIETIETSAGRKAVIEQHPLQPGDVTKTFADTQKASKLLGYDPSTTIEEGINRFVVWYKENRSQFKI
jgi:UDP-glucuronate 4-epimerase